MLAEAPQVLRRSLRRNTFNVSVLEPNSHESLALPVASIYTRTYLYTISPSADLEIVLREIYADARPRIAYSMDNARFRITYQDRSSLLIPNSRTTIGIRQEQLFDLDTFTSFYDAIMFLFTSNEELDAQDLLIALDVRMYEAGGERGCIEHPTPNCLMNSDGLFVISKHVDLLCGWVCIGIHFAMYNINGIHGYSDLLYKLTHKRKWCKEMQASINDNLYVTKQIGLFINNYFESTTNSFRLETDMPAVCAKFPELKITVINAGGLVISSCKGSSWNPTGKSEKQQLPYALCMVMDIKNSHLHYLENIKKYLCSGKDIKNYRFCHCCNTLLYKRALAKHKCVDNTCDKCVTFFRTDAELKKHKKKKDYLVSQNIGPEQFTDDTKCPVCDKICYNANCLDYHVRKCSKFGIRKKICDLCQKLVWNVNAHNCVPDGLTQCFNCEQIFERKEFARHRCFIKRQDIPQNVDMQAECRRFYAFDFESAFRTETRLDRGEEIQVEIHSVNFIGVQQCDTNETWEFENLDEFCVWLGNLPPNSIMVAHNLKGYDGRLLFEHYVKTLKVIPEDVTWNGSKIMNMKIGNVVFKDSLLHIQAPLEQFPKIFGLDETKFAKGFFPYKFNTIENWDYVGPIPVQSYFQPDLMNANKRKSFLEWHAKQKDTYIFKEELKKYCMSDVSILAQALTVYMYTGMELNSLINPMDHTTIAAYALKVYQAIHMPENTIAILNEEETLFVSKGFHGGRTDVRKMLKFYPKEKVANGVYAKYQDVQSLYPTVQFYDDLPVGIPVVEHFVDPETNISHKLQPSLETVKNWFGFVMCDIEPTSYIHHPVLVNRNEQKGKLLATLLPMKKVVVTTAELHQALAKGYLLSKVYAVHHYQKSNTLFRSYIQTYLKIKIECGGMPKHITNDTEWEEYRLYHLNNLGIVLDKEKMVKNAGMKQLAKMMLNSLWGKFAENKHYSTHFVFDSSDSDTIEMYQTLESMWNNGEIEVQTHLHIGEGKFLMIYKNMLEKNYNWNRAKRTNIAIASFVTAHGALRLWSELDKLDKRVIYHDTDSIIYEYDRDLYNIPEGKYLGEWEDETGGKPIVKFVSTGPKTYSYAYYDDEVKGTEENRELYNSLGIEYIDLEYSLKPLKYVSKCKGFTLNYHNSLKINFDTLMQLVTGVSSELYTMNTKFRWDRIRCSMETYFEKKKLAYCYDKGYVDADKCVLPFGYDRFEVEQPSRRRFTN